MEKAIRIAIDKTQYVCTDGRGIKLDYREKNRGTSLIIAARRGVLAHALDPSP